MDSHDHARQVALSRIAAAAPNSHPELSVAALPPSVSSATAPQDNSRKRKATAGAMNLEYCEFNLSTMVDSRAGFLIDENATAASVGSLRGDDASRTTGDAGRAPSDAACCECGSIDVCGDLYKHYKVLVCRKCRDNIKDKYSLLTKTECREDYLLTESELRDSEKLPCWVKKNPHKETYANMLLYLRAQVEQFAVAKWGSLENLDQEFARREEEKTARKRKKFETKINELRKRTLLTNSVLRRPKQVVHVHEYGEKKATVDGAFVQTCKGCGISSVFEEF